jgi:hypothetical protein
MSACILRPFKDIAKDIAKASPQAFAIFIARAFPEPFLSRRKRGTAVRAAR